MTEASPHAIYGHYICLRAQRVGITTIPPEHLGMARLSYLVRATPTDVLAVAGEAINYVSLAIIFSKAKGNPGRNRTSPRYPFQLDHSGLQTQTFCTKGLDVA